MKVYIVMVGDAYDNNVDKVFLNEKDAQNYVNADQYLFIEKHEVIE